MKDADNTPKDIIRLLPDSVANQIAAGEVIQRPASVIKELVENSVDAGATDIEIIIKDAGKTLIQVVDNGKGMSTTDARMAFERHATSKIRCADDLFTLHTMGFRGEALPSIAAVSELEITSRRPADQLATRLEIRGSRVENQEPVMAATGTNIKVKNLFFNFVARRRFLKKDSVELTHIIHEFERLALVNTDIAFKVISNGVTLHSLPRSPLKERITALFGRTIGQTLIPISADTSLVKISGFVSHPTGARQRGQRQFLFVNGRNMRHPYFHRAILSCYENLIAKDAQPHYFVNFEVAPDRIDVNIHPQKHEIKFEDEQSIWHILTASIREALGKCNATAALDFDTTGAPDIPPMTESGPIANAYLTDDVESAAGYNPFNLQPDLPSQPIPRLDFGNSTSRPSTFNSGQSPRGWESMFQSAKEQTPATLPGTELEPVATTQPRFLQVRNKYIVLDTRDGGMLLIDQHRAHVSIIYDRLMSQQTHGTVSSQNLIFPEPLELDAEQSVILDSTQELIEQLGFNIQGRGNDGRSILAIPGSIDVKNPSALLTGILNDIAETGTDAQSDTTSRIALIMARHAAIKGGQALTPAECEHLVSSLFRLSSPSYTPDGLKVIHRITDEKLLSWFI